MSPGLATNLALLLYVLGLVPFAWMALRPGSTRWLAPISGTLVLALALFQTGIFHGNALASEDVTELVQMHAPESRCRQVFEVLQENGVLLEPPGPNGLIVQGSAWDQLPSPIVEAVVACAQTSLTTTAAREVPVIRR